MVELSKLCLLALKNQTIEIQNQYKYIYTYMKTYINTTTNKQTGGDQVVFTGFGLSWNQFMVPGKNLQIYGKICILFSWIPYLHLILGHGTFRRLPELKVAALDPETFRTCKPAELLAKNPNGKVNVHFQSHSHFQKSKWQSELSGI